MVLKSDAKFEENWLVLFKWNEDFHRLKYSDFIFESKMAGLNQKKKKKEKSKQPDRLDAVWKLYFILEINE